MEHFLRRLGTYGTVAHANGRIDLVLDGDEVDIGGAPPGAVVAIAVGAGQDRVRLASAARVGHPPAWLSITLAPSCTSLVLERAAPKRTTVHAAGHDLVISCTEAQAGSLRITGHGRVTLDRAADMRVLDLDAAGGPLDVVLPEGVAVALLTIRGEVRLAGAAVFTDCLRLRRRARLQLGAELRTARLRLGSDRALVGGAGRLQAERLDAAGALDLDDAILLIGDGQHELAPLTVGGAGTLAVRGEAAALTLESSNRPIELMALRDARLHDVSGSVALRAERGSAVIGRVDGTFGPVAVLAAEGAVVQHMSPFGLCRLDDLARLGAATRATFWLPRHTTAALRRSDAMTIETKRDAPTGSGAVQFWEQAGELLNRNKASSSSQSMARYLAARARRRSSAPRYGRERIIYTLYGLVGYGERIAQPLAVYAALAFLLAMWVAPTTPLDLWMAWSQVLQAPLAFFEFGSRIQNLRLDPVLQLVVTAFQVVGIALIAVSLLAVRRSITVGRPFGD